MGGFQNGVPGSSDSAEMYDPFMDSVSALPSMGAARSEFGAARLGNLICAVGGQDASTNARLVTCECLDTTTNTWTDIGSLTTARYQHAVASVGDTMCAIGGKDASGDPIASVECYTDSTAVWTEVAALNTARSGFGAAGIGNVVFALSGLSVGGGTPISSVEALDLSVSGGSWQEKAPMPTARSNVAVASSGMKLFAVGGCGGNGNLNDQLEVYESATDSWSTRAPMQTARHSLGAAIVGNTLFCLGGSNLLQQNWQTLDVAEAFDIDSESWHTVVSLGTPRQSFATVAGPATLPYDPCAAVDCGSHGACVSPFGICTCTGGYTGEHCETLPACCSTLCYVCGSGTACDGCDGSCNSAGMDYCDAAHPQWDDDCDRSC